MLAEDEGVGDQCGVVGVGGGTVGTEGRLTVGCVLHAADLMGDDLAVVLHALGLVGDDVALLQSGRIDLLDQDQVTGIEVGLGHRVGTDDEGFKAKQITVVAVEGVDRYDGKYHHRHSHDHEDPDKYCGDDIPCFFHREFPLPKNIFARCGVSKLRWFVPKKVRLPLL